MHCLQHSHSCFVGTFLVYCTQNAITDFLIIHAAWTFNFTGAACHSSFLDKHCSWKLIQNSICDWARENKACGLKLHPITQDAISQP